MREEFEKMASAGKLHRHHIEALVQLTNSGFCMHRSWGFGRIKTVDTVFARFTIDFQNKAGHAMDLSFAMLAWNGAARPPGTHTNSASGFASRARCR